MRASQTSWVNAVERAGLAEGPLVESNNFKWEKQHWYNDPFEHSYIDKIFEGDNKFLEDIKERLGFNE